jgi:hypothetical protein
MSQGVPAAAFHLTHLSKSAQTIKERAEKGMATD